MLTLHVARLPSSCSEPSSRSPATVAGMKSSIRLLHAPWARPPRTSKQPGHAHTKRCGVARATACFDAKAVDETMLADLPNRGDG